MKTRYWIVILVIIAIVVIGIVFFMCDSFPRPFFPRGKHKVVNQYEIFRDLLIIFLTLAGLSITLGGLAMYKWISKGLEIMVKKKANEEMDYAMCTFYLERSYDSWQLYEVKGRFQKKEKRALEIALEESKKALARAERLDIKQKDSKLLVCLAKNNLAYHLAVKNCIEDTEKAISLAKYAYDRVEDFDFETNCYWKETYAYVLIRVGTKEQKKEGWKIIKELWDRRYLPEILRSSMDGKYTKNLTLRPNWD